MLARTFPGFRPRASSCRAATFGVRGLDPRFHAARLDGPQHGVSSHAEEKRRQAAAVQITDHQPFTNAYAEDIEKEAVESNGVKKNGNVLRCWTAVGSAPLPNQGLLKKERSHWSCQWSTGLSSSHSTGNQI